MLPCTREALLVVTSLDPDTTTDVGPNAAARVLVPVNAVRFVRSPLEPSAVKGRLSVNDGDGAKSLTALHVAKPRKQHVEHAADFINGVDAPAINEFVRSDLLVWSVDPAERNAVHESGELLRDH